MNQSFQRSSAQIIKIVPKSVNDNEFIRNPSQIPVGKLAIFALGGEETTDEYKARFYGRYIREILRQNDIKGIDLYSTFYAFGSRVPSHDRAELFRAAGRNVIELDADNTKRAQQIATVDKFETKPVFVQILFEHIFKPRIVNQYGRRHDINTAIQYARNAIFFTHCQGTSTMLMLQRMLQQAMLNAGYTQAEIDLFLKNIITINHEPLAPLSQLKTTSVSFMSIHDAVLRNNNMIDAVFLENAEKVNPLYIENTRTLIVPNVRDEMPNAETDEHSTFDLGEKSPYKVSKPGKILFAAERNAVVKSVLAAIERKPIPTNLITGRGVKFSDLTQNAQDFMRVAYRSPQIQVHDYQK